jgi:hypothetical protein
MSIPPVFPAWLPAGYPWNFSTFVKVWLTHWPMGAMIF